MRFSAHVKLTVFQIKQKNKKKKYWIKIYTKLIE